MLITSNQPVGEWEQVFGDAVAATAILDRLVASQPGDHDSGRQLPAARQAPQRPSAEGRCPHHNHIGELINPGGQFQMSSGG